VAAAASRDVAIVACCDAREDAAEAWSERHGCEQSYPDYATMLREHELDAVILATWPNLHREQVLGCLEAGVRNVLCEKALALTGAEALEIWTAAAEAEALVVEGYMYRHHPALRTMDEVIAGEIGEVDSVAAAFSLFDSEESSPDDPGRDWRQRKECGGGVPYDLACYCVDACNRFAHARPRQVRAVSTTSARYGTVDRLYGLVEYENGVVGMLASSKGSDFDHELRVNGARGHVVLPVAWRIDHPTAMVARRSVGWGKFETTQYPVPVVDAHRLQLESFAAAVRGEGVATPTLAESVLDAYTMDALLASAAEGVAVAVEVPQVVPA
jgi:predicted dehydrogenase